MFVVSIMFLIVSLNMISILLGWDGLGLVSFCFRDLLSKCKVLSKSYGAGMLTVLSNQTGDVALLTVTA
jgi:NADH-ubiquinone oxidoreductase chain 5